MASLSTDDELDLLLAARNWNVLGKALSTIDSPASFSRSMNWLHTRIDAGGGMLLPLLYARDLWIVGKAKNIDDPLTDMRQTAAMMALCTYELIVIDGAKCEDQSAPGHRLDQLFMARAETIAFIKKRPQNEKDFTVTLALKMEEKTAPLRKDDDLICRDGLAQYKAAFESGTPQHEVATQAGHFGKTAEIEAPPGWSPKFVAPEVYLPLQKTARTGMRDRLLKLVE